ncbi:hypothetical protein V8F20_010929 [Naviculisporaceae sp. PSN 640]
MSSDPDDATLWEWVREVASYIDRPRYTSDLDPDCPDTLIEIPEKMATREDIEMMFHRSRNWGPPNCFIFGPVRSLDPATPRLYWLASSWNWNPRLAKVVDSVPNPGDSILTIQLVT